MKFKKLSWIISFFFSAAALAMHGYLGTFSRYLADDFCSAYYARRLGILRAAWFWYLNWSGRFSASVLDAVVGSFHPSLARLVVAATILLWLTIITVFLIYVLAPRENILISCIALATVILFALFLLAPDIRQSLYWGQGMRSVIPPLILGTIQVMLWKYVRSRTWSGWQLIGWGVFSFFAALIAGGFSETYAAFQVAAFLGVLIFLIVTQKFKYSAPVLFTITALAGAICALIFIIRAPGNAERQAFYPAPPGMIGILIISLRSYFSYILHLLDAPEKLLAIAGTFTLAASIGGQVAYRLNARLVVVILFFIVAFTFVCFPPAAYGLSDAPPPRTQILPTYFFLAGLVALGIVCGNLLMQQNKSLTFFSTAAVIAIIVAASINCIHLYQSRGEFIRYANDWDRTEASIVAAKQNGAKEILIPVIPNWAQLNTPNDNPKFWVNACLSAYYDIQIRAKSNLSSQ